MQTIRFGWLILIKHSVLNILWFIVKTQTNKRTMRHFMKIVGECHGNLRFFPVEIECNKMMIVFVALFKKSSLICSPQKPKETSCQLSKFKKSSSNESWQLLRLLNQNKYSKYLMKSCWQPRMRQRNTSFFTFTLRKFATKKILLRT